MENAKNIKLNQSEKNNDWYKLSEQNQVKPKSLPRFLIVKMEEQGKSFNEVSPFHIHRWICSFSKSIGVKKLRKTGVLFLDSPSNSITSKLLEQQLFNGYRITIQPHKTLNQSRGVFFSSELRDLKEEEILKELAGQNVCSVRRLGDPSKKSGLFVATFMSPQLPEKLFLGYLSVPLRAYIPPPLLCYRCGILGHHMSSCEKERVCRKCAEPLHENECTKVKCCLCGGEHRTTAKLCPIYAEEYEVKKTMVLQKLNYYEAKRQVKNARTETYARKTICGPTEPSAIEKLTNLMELMSKRMSVLENLLVGKYSETERPRKEEDSTIARNTSSEVGGSAALASKIKTTGTQEDKSTSEIEENPGKDKNKKVTQGRQNKSKIQDNGQQDIVKSKKR